MIGMMISPLRMLALDSDVCPTPVTYVWKPGEEAWVKSFDLVSTGDIVRPGSKSLTYG